MNNILIDDFKVTIKQEEDGTYLAKFNGIQGLQAWGPSPEEALGELIELWDIKKENCKKYGEELPQAQDYNN